MVLHRKSSEYLIWIISCCGLLVCSVVGRDEILAVDKHHSGIDTTPSIQENGCLVNISFDLTNMGLRRIPKGFLASPYVTRLNLEDNEIKEVSLDSFEDLPNLEYLNLAGNKFGLIKFLGSGGHKNLKTLILDRIELSNHSQSVCLEDTFYYDDCADERFEINAKFPELSSLHVKDIKARDFPENLKDFMPNLKYLYFSGNTVRTTINNIFSGIPSTLSHLYLEKNEIQHMSNIQNNVGSVTALYLDENEISHLGKLDCLLHFEKCLMAEFEAFRNLELLSISKNKISRISHDSFFYNSKLEIINLSDNDIFNIDGRAFQNLKNLRSLNLSDNLLLKMVNLCGLKKLTDLYFDRNGIKSLDSGSFCGSTSLEILSLSGNGIEQIGSGTFDKLRNLSKLNLSANKLSHIEFESGSNLRYLFLGNNQFEAIDNIRLGNITSLDILDIRDNKITTRSLFETRLSIANKTINVKELKF